MAKKKQPLGTSKSNADKITLYAPSGTKRKLKIFAGRHEIKANDVVIKGIDMAMEAIERGV